MKKLLLFNLCLCLFIGVQAADIQTVATTPGHLYTDASACLKTVTNLTITGTIDARDFGTIRKYMSLLSEVNLSKVSIVSYQNGNNSFQENEIPNYAFYNCTNLTSMQLPATITSIGTAAFYGCTGLTGKLLIPRGVTTIGDNAFFSCSALTAVTIPSTVISFGYQAFGYCSGLKDITVPSSVSLIGDYAFAHCTGLVFITLPSSVTSIGNCAFQGCTGLTSVSIPSSVTSIGNYAFDNCVLLTSINVYGTDPGKITLGSTVFYFVPKSTCKLNVPSDTKALYAAAAQWKDFTNKTEMITTTTSKLSGKSKVQHSDVTSAYLAVLKE